MQLDKVADPFSPVSAACQFWQLIGQPPITCQPLQSVQVRDYTFSPDTGRIDALRYDALGIPAIPASALVVSEVGLEAVAEVRRGAVVLRPGAEGAAVRVSEGPLGLALELALVCLTINTALTTGIHLIAALLLFALSRREPKSIPCLPEDAGFIVEEPSMVGLQFVRCRHDRRSVWLGFSVEHELKQYLPGEQNLWRDSSPSIDDNDDPDYAAWRRLHGADWARWYGLQVRRLRIVRMCSLVLLVVCAAGESQPEYLFIRKDLQLGHPCQIQVTGVSC